MHPETSIAQMCDAYLLAKRQVIDHGFESELLWQLRCSLSRPTESQFLREAAWVVLSTGFSEKVVRSIFPKISAAFKDWNSALSITVESEKCRSKALTVFKGLKKINAIIEISTSVAEDGFDQVWSGVEQKGPEYLRRFPFVGAATSLHLAKNLGLQVAKPDRHLQRIANHFGYTNVNTFCFTISEYVGDEVAEVDLVLWRYATIRRNYLIEFSEFVAKSNRITPSSDQDPK